MTAPASLEGGGFAVVFTRRGDRVGHAVLRTDCAAAAGEHLTSAPALLESIEGTAEDDWPTSPPLKELHFENRPDGRRLALLIGMAGRSHWSLSVELDASAGRVTFDVACRLRSQPERLGSTYRLPSIAAGGVATGGPGHLTIQAGPLTIEASPSTRLTCVDSQIVVEPIGALGPWPQTVRWWYVVRRANIVGTLRVP